MYSDERKGLYAGIFQYSVLPLPMYANNVYYFSRGENNELEANLNTNLSPSPRISAWQQGLLDR